MTNNVNTMTLLEKVETDDIRKEFIATSENGRYNDLMILQLFTEVYTPDTDVKQWIVSQLPNGSWSDIEYGDKKRSRWEPAYHATRIQSMTKLFRNLESTLYNSA